MASRAELEIVKYKTSDMIEVSQALIGLFAGHSNIEGTQYWWKPLIALQNIIAREQDITYPLIAKGLVVTYYGPTWPTPRIEGVAGHPIYRAKEPRFIIEQAGYLPPQERTHAIKVSEEITEEMSKIYDLKPGKYPDTLLFDKRIYAKSIVLYDAILITPNNP